MAIERYLAMTAEEIAVTPRLPDRLGYMACHFSPYGTGLSNCPTALLRGAMLILNDRIPLRGHDPKRILARLRELTERLACGSVLLDFETAGSKEAAAMAQALAEGLSCPVGISAAYARKGNCAVFLPPVPCDTRLEEYLAPWQGREIWLEAALDSMDITLTAEGATVSPSLYFDGPAPFHADSKLHCRYQISRNGENVRFSLCRGPAELEALVQDAERLGVTRMVGLHQELRGIWI